MATVSLWPMVMSLLVQVQDTPSLSLDDVARANAAAVTAIQSLVLRIKCLESKVGEPLAQTDSMVYRFEGDRERLTLDRLTIPASDTGDRMGYADRYNGPDGSKSIIGYDPDRPPHLDEVTLSRSHGILGPRLTGPRRATSIARNQLLLEIGYGNNSWLLRDLIANSTSRLVAAPSTSTRHCYEIEVKRPEIAFNVSVDPAANFMIRRSELVPTPRTQPKVAGPVEVEAFQDCGDGVFIPTLIVGQEVQANGEVIQIRREIEVLSCNKPLPAAAFEITFPDWLPVTDHRSGKIHYWGPEGRPRLTFDSAEEQRKWWLPRYSKALRARSAGRFPWSLVVGGFTVVVAVGAALLRRVRNQRG